MQHLAERRMRQSSEAKELEHVTRTFDRLDLALDDPALTRRRSGELRASAQLVHQRRWSEQARRRAAAEATMSRVRQTVAGLRTDIATLNEVVERNLATRRARVTRIHHHAQRRLAAYRRSLIRRHPVVAAVDAMLATVTFELPAWTNTPWTHVEDEQ